MRRTGNQLFSTCATLWTPILLQLNERPRGRKRTQGVPSKRNQSTASPTEPKAKAAGKAAAVARPPALAPRKRRPPDLATRPMARTDVADTRTGADAGTGSIPATAGLSSDYALSFLQLSQQSSPLYEGCITGLDFANPNHCEAFAFLTSPAQAEAVAVHLIHTHHAISNE